MGNNTLTLRSKRWVKFALHSVGEKLRGLDFSMVYVGDIQRETAEFHGYSMTDADDMKRMLEAVPVEAGKTSFLDVGCGKGMCMKCAVESGYRKVAGLDLDPHLLDIARRNMAELKLDAECIYANAAEFGGYGDYDVFYFYNPFGRPVFERVIQKLKESREERDRDIWVVYYHPVFGGLFEAAGFVLENELRDTTRGTSTKYYRCPQLGGRKSGPHGES